MAKIIILRGLPGSGKSYIANNAKLGKGWRDDVILCSADFTFIKIVDGKEVYYFDPSKLPEAHAACLRHFITSCQIAQEDAFVKFIYVDNTNLSVAEIAPYYAIAQAYGHEVEIVTVTCDPKVAFERQTHGVPEATFRSMQSRLADGTRQMMPWWKHTII